MQLTTDELLMLLGSKEAENYALRRDLAKVVEELNAARAELHESKIRPTSADEKENT